MIRARVSSLLVPALFSVGLLVPAAAQAGCLDGKNRRVALTNASSDVLERFYASSFGVLSEDEDILGESVLQPGKSVTINFDDGSCRCVLDFKFEYRRSDESRWIAQRYNVNVCAVSELSGPSGPE